MHMRYKSTKLPIPTKKKYKKKVIGYIGLAIGLIELLQRRGYIDPKLPKNNYLITKLLEKQ